MLSNLLMAGTSTIIGFGVLCFAEHSMLQSIGVTSLLGIGYSLIGAFLLLPPLLNFYFTERTPKRSEGLPLATRVRNRYRFMEVYPRMFARIKLQTDPMFTDLPELLAGKTETIESILDIGCGYGVPGCWFLEYFPEATITGVDPDPERLRIAGLAMGNRGSVVEDKAPEMVVLDTPPELILLLDMLHYLDDSSLKTLFANCFQTIAPQGILLARYATLPEGTPSWSWKLEDFRTRLSGGQTHYRSGAETGEYLQQAGFIVEINRVSRSNPELIWIMGRAEKK